MVADEFILNLDSVGLNDKNSLPEYSGIYYVVDADKVVWYIGRSVNLWQRWNAEQPHHRYYQLISLAEQENKSFYIYYLETHKKELHTLEKKQIHKYQPRLNNTPAIKGKYNKQDTATSYNLLEHDKSIDINVFSKSSSVENTCEKGVEDMSKNGIDNINKNSQALINFLKQFDRRFINLRDEDTNLNFQIEICINSRNKLFVRHYMLTIVYDWALNVIESNDDNNANHIIKKVKSLCQQSYPASIKWLGCRLECETVLLTDDNSEMESIAVMLPYSMFVDFVENQWSKDWDFQALLKQEKSYFCKTERSFSQNNQMVTRSQYKLEPISQEN